jgi:hypothetical protein
MGESEPIQRGKPGFASRRCRRPAWQLGGVSPGFLQRTRRREVAETVWNGLRLIVAYDLQVANEAGVKRDARIAELHSLAAQRAGKLDDRDQFDHGLREGKRVVGGG